MPVTDSAPTPLVVLEQGHGYPSSGQLGHWLDALAQERRQRLVWRIVAGLAEGDDIARYHEYGARLVDAYHDDMQGHSADWRGFGAAYRDCDDVLALDVLGDDEPAGADCGGFRRAVRGKFVELFGRLTGPLRRRVETAWASTMAEVYGK